MTARADIARSFGPCVPGSASGGRGCREVIERSHGLNGFAPRQTNPTREGRVASAPARSPWVAIVVAIVAVVLVLGAELWTARHAPEPEGTLAKEVATDVSTTLGEVAATSILIDP